MKKLMMLIAAAGFMYSTAVMAGDCGDEKTKGEKKACCKSSKETTDAKACAGKEGAAEKKACCKSKDGAEKSTDKKQEKAK